MVSINKVHKTPVKWPEIKLLMLDCDGVLTDGRIIYAGAELELKNFDAHDGMGFNIMRYADIKVAVITGRSSAALQQRCRDLRIEYLYQGVAHKLNKANDLLQEINLTWANVVYIGDDWNDVPAMRKAALSFAPFDACEDIKRQADMVCALPGGRGAIREVIDLILHKQGRYEQAVSAYLADIS